MTQMPEQKQQSISVFIRDRLKLLRLRHLFKLIKMAGYPLRALRAANKSLIRYPHVALDMARSLLRSGCMPDEYISYGFYGKTPQERAAYFLHYDNVKLIEAINGAADLGDNSALNVLRDKQILLDRMGPALGRSYLDLGQCSDEQFVAFTKQHPKFVTKPRALSGGRNVGVVDLSEAPQDVRMLKKHLLEQDITLIESFILQHPRISAIYPHAVNTIRIHTLRTGDQVEVVLEPIIRFGMHGRRINSEGEHAVFVKIDRHHGELHPFGITGMEKVYRHADSQVVFAGYRIPYFAEAMALALRLGHIVPEVRFIGWDIAITAEGPVVVEGNGGSMGYVDIQRYDMLERGTGSKPTYQALLRYDQRRERLTPEWIAKSEQALFVAFGHPQAQMDAVVVLGSAQCRYRIEEAWRRYGQLAEVPFIVSGGNLCQEADAGEDADILTEAAYMRRYLLRQGVAAARIQVEDQSRDTAMNVTFVLDLLDKCDLSHPERRTPNIAIVSAGFHMRRVQEALDRDPRSSRYHFHAVPAYGPNTGKDNWHTNAQGLEIVITELKKFDLPTR